MSRNRAGATMDVTGDMRRSSASAAGRDDNRDGSEGTIARRWCGRVIIPFQCRLVPREDVVEVFGGLVLAWLFGAR